MDRLNVFNIVLIYPQICHRYNVIIVTNRLLFDNIIEKFELSMKNVL